MLMDFIASDWVFMVFYGVLLGFIDIDRILLGFIGFDWVSLGYTRSYWV